MREGWRHTDKRPSEPKDKLLSPDRRLFLSTLAAAVGTAVFASNEIPKYVEKMLEQSSHKADSIPLRERLLDSAVKAIGANIRSPKIVDALNGKGKDPLLQIVNAARYPIKAGHLKGTSYDIEPLSIRYQTQLALFPDEGISNRPLANRVSVHSETASAERTDFFSTREAGYGNGIYWSHRHLLLTAEHVVAMFHPEKPELGSSVLDIGLLRVHKRFAASENTEVVHDSGTLSNKDIHGAFVAIAGIDPDETSNMKGRKIYPGVAVKVSRPIAERILKSDPSKTVEDDDKHTLRKRLERSFMIILPKRESRWNASAKSRPAMGMSGSAVFVRHADRLTFGGTFWGAMQIEVDGEEVDVGFFHGIDEIREATKEKKVESITEPK